jgi:dGTPase
MDWNALLSDHRFPREGREPRPASPEPYRSAFEADYDRIVYSAPFRRLARKTQVHPMAPHDHVHNRLTHSIEVASVGRSLGRRLARFLRDRNEVTAEQATHLPTILQAACLVHDIGNPPFGHAGEFAIREWVAHHPALFQGPDGEPVDPALQADWRLFEGNAQGFRFAARPDIPRSGYMRLTYATLGAMIKYPWDATDPRAVAKGKFNVFSTERDGFAEMSAQLGLTRQDGTHARHPLSLLSEAADDICYRLLDLEDAVAMGILQNRDVLPVLRRLTPGEPNTDLVPLLRGQAVESLIGQTWEVFASAYPAIMAGQREADLKTDFDQRTRAALDDIKQLYRAIFAHRAKVATELGAYETLGRIIDVLSSAVRELVRAGSFQGVDFLTQRRLELAWGEAYATEHATRDYAWWLHQVMDYVAGLTDNYARQISREIAGV